MNLWAKRAGLLLAAAVLFLISCDDDFILGFPGKKKIKGTYKELVFDGTKSSVVLLDSVFTDQFLISQDASPNAYRYLFGQYTDPDFGIVRADVYTGFTPNDAPGIPVKIKKPAQGLDSVTVQLVFDYYTYGPEIDINDSITVYELLDSLNFSARYFNYSTVPYNTATPVGKLKFKKFSKRKIESINLDQLHYELQLDKRANLRDTIMLHGRLNLDEGPSGDEVGFAKRLFTYLSTQPDSALIGKYIRQFRNEFPGFALVSAGTGRMIGVNPLSAFSRITMHYHTATEDSLSLELRFSPLDYSYSDGFNNITTQRTGGLAGITTPMERYYPSGPYSDERYIQDGSSVITELDLEDFYSFVDTLENAIINSAELSLDVKSYPAGMSPPEELYAMIMKKMPGNKLAALNMDIAEDSTKMLRYASTIYTDLKNFAVPSETSIRSPLTLAYSSSNQRYSGFATLFFQALYENKDDPEYKIEHLGLYTGTAPLMRRIAGYTSPIPILKTGSGNALNRAILKTSGIKLKLYYTIPNSPNID